MRQAARVAVIGGGCAGLAAASQLAAQGVNVTLFEAARQPGGRARGLNWKGCRLDNGQHILLGAYTDTLRLLRQAGVDTDATLMRLPLRLSQAGEAGFRLRASGRLPAPLHIAAGLLRARGLGLRERLAALRFMTTMRLRGFRLERDEALAALLARQRQPAGVVKWLWEPICLAALNTPLAQASAQVFLNVLRDSFARARADSDLLLPRRDLSALLAEPLAETVRRCGTILTATPVTAVRRQGAGYTVEYGEMAQEFSHVVLAVPPWRVAEPVAPLAELAGTARWCAALRYQPIYTVYLQYDSSVRLPYPMLALGGMHAQWVLDRGALDGQAGLLAVVISAEGTHQDITQETLAERVAAELAAVFPQLATPRWHKVIAEKRATFACTPGLERPAQSTAAPHFYLAGDYTAGDYPATIEGAVRSGLQCARMIMESLQ